MSSYVTWTWLWFSSPRWLPGPSEMCRLVFWKVSQPRQWSHCCTGKAQERMGHSDLADINGLVPEWNLRTYSAIAHLSSTSSCGTVICLHIFLHNQASKASVARQLSISWFIWPFSFCPWWVVNCSSSLTLPLSLRCSQLHTAAPNMLSDVIFVAGLSPPGCCLHITTNVLI